MKRRINGGCELAYNNYGDVIGVVCRCGKPILLDQDLCIPFTNYAFNHNTNPKHPRVECSLSRKRINIASMVIVVGKGMVPDHINGDIHDNRRVNLRQATPSQNAANRRKQCNNTSGYIGVCKAPYGWSARVKTKGVSRSVGYFKTKEEAAKARDKVALEIFGNYAKLNFPHDHRTN